MNRIFWAIVAILVLALPVVGQPSNPSVIPESPPATCTAGVPLWSVFSTGTLYICNNGTPTAIGGGGGGGNLSGTLTPGIYPIATAAHTLGDGTIDYNVRVPGELTATSPSGIIIANVQSGTPASVPNASAITFDDRADGDGIYFLSGGGSLYENGFTNITQQFGGIGGTYLLEIDTTPVIDWGLARGDALSLQAIFDSDSAIVLQANADVEIGSTLGVVLKGASGVPGALQFTAGATPPVPVGYTVQISAPATVATPYNVTLPAAQGTGALTNDGSGVLSWTARLAVGQHGWNSYVAFGDSITYGYTLTYQADSYVNRNAYAIGVTPVNYGTSGAQSCDVPKLQVFPNFNPRDEGNPLYSMMIGTNDAYFESAPNSYEAVASLCRQAAVTWMATSLTQKYPGSAFGTPPTNWSADNTYSPNVVGIQSTTNAATATWPITTTGGPIAIWYRIIDGNGGTFTYSLDGGATTSVTNSTTPVIATHNGTTDSVGVVIITGASGTPAVPVAHNIATVVTSATGAGNIVSILAVGTTNPSDAKNPPYVWESGITYQLNNTASTATAAYNTDTQTDVTTLSGDGFGVSWVNIRNYIGSTSLDMANQLHPNDVGHQHIFDAFYNAIQPVGGGGTQTNGTTEQSVPQMETPLATQNLLSAGTGWTSTGWTGSYAAGFTHTTGNTTALTNSFSTAAFSVYEITFTVSGTAGSNFTVGIGGQTSFTYTASGTYAVRALTSGVLTFTPGSTFQGTISNINLILLSSSPPLNEVLDSSGTTQFEQHASLAANYNQFLGAFSGSYNLGGIQNTFSGYAAGRFNTSGYDNTFTGYAAGQNTGIGFLNTASGFQALAGNTSGYHNAAFGGSALFTETTGNDNTAAGFQALENATTATYNTVMGSTAMQSDTTGSNNSAFGVDSLMSNTTGLLNSAFGAYALQYLVGTYQDNTAIGYLAGRYYGSGTSQLTQCGQCSFFGDQDSAGANNDTNETTLGYKVVGNGSNTATIGNSSVTKVYNAGVLMPATLYSAAGTALPACAVGYQGGRAVVSDATSPTYMAAYSSGGAITAEVICSYNGSSYSWLTH